MKQIFLACVALVCVQAAFAQSDRYVNAMKKNIAMLDSVPVKSNFDELSNNFLRIGDAEKSQWLPYYYAAYVTALQGVMERDLNKKDQIADYASEILKKAENILNKENSEIEVIKSMIATAHMTVDPQSRYMTYGQEISEAIAKSKQLDSTNPRPVLIQAQNLYYTPEFAGGGKDVARPLFEKAQQLFAFFKPETEISPNWGKSTVEFYLKSYK